MRASSLLKLPLYIFSISESTLKVCDESEITCFAPRSVVAHLLLPLLQNSTIVLGAMFFIRSMSASDSVSSGPVL